MKEEGDLSGMHDSILQTEAGKQIPIKDMFRIGQKPLGSQEATVAAQPRSHPRPTW